MRCGRGELLQRRLAFGGTDSNMRSGLCALVLLLAAQGAAARSSPLPLEVGEPCPSRPPQAISRWLSFRVSTVVIVSQYSHSIVWIATRGVRSQTCAGAEDLQAPQSVDCPHALCLLTTAALKERRVRIALCSC